MICNSILMPPPNHNANHIDKKVLETDKVFKYLSQRYLLGVIFICFAAQNIMGD